MDDREATAVDPETRAGLEKDNDWPVREDVLQSLSEDLRPATAERRDPRADVAVAAAVRACLAERVEPTGRRALGGLPRRRWWRQWPGSAGPRPGDPRDEATVLAAARTQTRLMAVPSRYPPDGEYYAANAPHASRTVEELRLCRWTAAERDDEAPPLVYTAGTVLHRRDTGACHLRGLTDPRCLVPVDCARLTSVLPRHLSTVKMFAELRVPSRDVDGPVLVPHHFQTFAASVPCHRAAP